MYVFGIRGKGDSLLREMGTFEQERLVEVKGFDMRQEVRRERRVSKTVSITGTPISTLFRSACNLLLIFNFETEQFQPQSFLSWQQC